MLTTEFLAGTGELAHFGSADPLVAAAGISPILRFSGKTSYRRRVRRRTGSSSRVGYQRGGPVPLPRVEDTPTLGRSSRLTSSRRTSLWSHSATAGTGGRIPHTGQPGRAAGQVRASRTMPSKTGGRRLRGLWASIK